MIHENAASWRHCPTRLSVPVRQDGLLAVAVVASVGYFHTQAALAGETQQRQLTDLALAGKKKQRQRLS